MNNAELDQFKRQLLALRSELQAMEESSRESTRPVQLDQASVGRLSRMDAMQGQQMAVETERRRKHQLLKIEGALQRMETGDYGYCVICGEDIDRRRLSIDPTSTRCMPCIDK